MPQSILASEITKPLWLFQVWYPIPAIGEPTLSEAEAPIERMNAGELGAVAELVLDDRPPDIAGAENESCPRHFRVAVLVRREKLLRKALGGLEAPDAFTIMLADALRVSRYWLQPGQPPPLLYRRRGDPAQRPSPPKRPS